MMDAHQEETAVGEISGCLSYATEFEIAEEAGQLLEDLGFDAETCDIDMFDVAARLCIVCKSYTELNLLGLILALLVSPYGISFFDKTKMKFVIYYNDRLEAETVQRTLAHEIGHIQRGHYLKPILSHIAEAEADCFGQSLLQSASLEYVYGMRLYERGGAA